MGRGGELSVVLHSYALYSTHALAPGPPSTSKRTRQARRPRPDHVLSPPRRASASPAPLKHHCDAHQARSRGCACALLLFLRLTWRAAQKVYKADICSPVASTSSLPPPAPLLLKHRFAKAYRHAQLDSQLTRSRIAQEARCLVRCAKYGVQAPGVRCVDIESGVLGIEWIDGRSVRDLLGADEDGEEGPGDEEEEVDVDAVAEAFAELGLAEGALSLAARRRVVLTRSHRRPAVAHRRRNSQNASRRRDPRRSDDLQHDDPPAAFSLCSSPAHRLWPLLCFQPRRG